MANARRTRDMNVGEEVVLYESKTGKWDKTSQSMPRDKRNI
jgi:hypothetical protein